MSQVLKPRKGYKFVDAGFEKFDEIPEDWKYEEFQDIIKKDNTKKIKIKTLDYENKGKIPIIDQGQDLICGYTDDVTLTYSGKLPVIVFGDHTLAVKFIDFPFAIGADGTKIIQINQDNGLVKFFYYAIQNRNLASEGYKRHFSKLREQKFCYPTIVTEQEKIASILSNVDNLITSTQKIIEKTERLKKGMMQKLLTRGIGHDKFKKVKWNYGKLLEIPKTWDIVLLDTVAQRGSGHTPDIKKPEFYNGGIKWISLADSNRLDNIHISETTKEISQKGIENSSAVIHPSGVVVLSRDAGVGKSAITKTEMAVSQHFMVWQCGEHLNNYFLYYLLQFWKSLFESIAIGTTIPTIGLSFFKKFRIIFPQKIEQDKIANILSNVDSQIQSQTQYKEKLEKVKKSLMQKLLTGQVRVTV